MEKYVIIIYKQNLVYIMKAIVKNAKNQHFIIMIIVNAQNNAKLVINMIQIVQVAMVIKLYLMILFWIIIANVNMDIMNPKNN